MTLVLVTTCQLGLVAWYAPTTLEGASLPLLEEEFHTKVIDLTRGTLHK